MIELGNQTETVGTSNTEIDHRLPRVSWCLAGWTWNFFHHDLRSARLLGGDAGVTGGWVGGGDWVIWSGWPGGLDEVTADVIMLMTRGQPLLLLGLRERA